MPNSIAYQEEVSRLNPSAIIFLLDQSGSMSSAFGGNIEGTINPSKAQGATDAVNHCLREILVKCAKEEGIRDYFHLGAWGYGGSVRGLLGVNTLIPASEVETRARFEDVTQQVPDGTGGLVGQVIRLQVWASPTASGGTPMCQALGQVRDEVSQWLAQHPDSYPPTVINITDGESTDGDPRSIAADIMHLTNGNGSSPLLFNIHISDSTAPPVRYPARADALPTEHAKLLFAMSSELPQRLMAEAAAGGLPVTSGSRGFVFNGNLVDLIKFLDIGTRPTVDAAR